MNIEQPVFWLRILIRIRRICIISMDPDPVSMNTDTKHWRTVTQMVD